ncbi:MAG TPA: VOC family protein [Thermoanaerobaculia bacterium]|nr:VOC family protein [Thermoanaerobaculia bacterium]
MSRVAFDHIAIAVPRIEDALPFLVGELGGRPAGGGAAPGFRFRQWIYGGGKLELLEPAGRAGGFLHRFLERRGPGVHHLTFYVPDLAAACADAEEHGFPVVQRDVSDPEWKEAFLHPKAALSIVVQLVERSGPGSDQASGARAPASGDPEPGALGVELVGLRLAAADLGRARRLWGALLGGSCRVQGDELEVRWPGSLLRLLVRRTVEVEPEGPTAVELACLRPVVLPRGRHPVLGTVFEPVDITELAPPPLASEEENAFGLAPGAGGGDDAGGAGSEDDAAGSAADADVYFLDGDALEPDEEDPR